MFQAQLRELDADVCIKLRLRDRLQQLVVDVGGTMRFGFRGDALAKRVKRDGDALGVNLFGYTQRIGRLHARDKALTEANAQAGIFAEMAQWTIMGECNESRTKEWHESPLPESVPAQLSNRLVSHK